MVGQDKMKAIIPVAGFGSRMLPSTKSIPKEMLPLLDKPLIQYIVEECIAAGIKDIIFVNHSSKQAIENHFDTQFELEQKLLSKQKFELLNDIKPSYFEGLNIISVRQHEPKGLGHAVLCAASVAAQEAVAVLLPDVILNNRTFDPSSQNLRAMIDRFMSTGHSQVMLQEVPSNEVNKYGIGDLRKNVITPGESAEVFAFVEKPQEGSAPSNLAMVGRYVFSSGIWDKLKGGGAGTDGEIQLTDAMDDLIKSEVVEAYSLVGKSYDCGSKLGYIKAFIEFAATDSRFERDVRTFVKQFK